MYLTVLWSLKPALRALSGRRHSTQEPGQRRLSTGEPLQCRQSTRERRATVTEQATTAEKEGDEKFETPRRFSSIVAAATLKDPKHAGDPHEDGGAAERQEGEGAGDEV